MIDEIMELLKMVGYNQACYDKKYRKFWLKNKREVIKFIDENTKYYLREEAIND
jgi:hypothetical protein